MQHRKKVSGRENRKRTIENRKWTIRVLFNRTVDDTGIDNRECTFHYLDDCQLKCSASSTLHGNCSLRVLQVKEKKEKYE